MNTRNIWSTVGRQLFMIPEWLTALAGKTVFLRGAQVGSRAPWILAVVLFSSGCGDDVTMPWESVTVKDIQKEGVLTVITRNAPTTYYHATHGLAGIEYDLTQALGEALGVEVRYIMLESIQEILEAMEEGKAHIAAAGLTRTEEREKKFTFSPSYQSVQQQVVCRRGKPRPKSPEELVGRSIALISHSSYAERMRELRESIPELEWIAVTDATTEEILERVWREEVDCAIADSNIVAINRRYHPELAIAFPLTEAQELAWIIHPHAKDLLEFIENWIQAFEDEGKLAALHDRYYGYVEIFDYVDTVKFRQRIYERLPKYQSHFERVSEQYNLPWIVIAAQAYQESHWNPRARSPTGVRGIMMLTLNAAKDLKIKNRLDPKQSIEGGARYLRGLLDRLPEEIPEDERLWFALAAYNVGYGHLLDARILAERQGLDPNRWHDIKQVLPLLSKKKYYKTLKRGYARGYEPVRYIERIRNYADILREVLNAEN